MTDSKPSILVLYRASRAPLRRSLSDHLFSFRCCADARCVYVNIVKRRLPAWLAGEAFDVIVFHTTVLSSRWHRAGFPSLIDRLRFLASSPAVKIALPQDEFISTDLLCDFLNELRVDHVFSVAPESEWEKIYSSLDRERTRLHRVLTGYLDESTVCRIQRLSLRVAGRPIDIGYRAHGIRHSLGAHGQLKISIARAVAEKAPAHSLVTDISTEYADTLYGDAWYRFLLRCRYVIGVEGGASVYDRDGSLWTATQEYVRHHPEATFAEVRDACFPDRDGSLQLVAISPRHLEACATRTAQILVEGEYNGILIPDVHYIALRRDLGNLDEVLAQVRDDELRERLVERAYFDVVESGLYTYRKFAGETLRTALAGGRAAKVGSAGPRLGAWKWAWMAVLEWLSWTRPFLRGGAAKLFYGTARRLPEDLRNRLLAWRRARISK